MWAYHRFALSTADVEDLLAERGVIVSRETVRKWVNRFGRHFARCVKRDRPTAADKWHLDEVVIPIRGVKIWLWRAVDGNGDVLDILVQPRRNAKAAKRFLRRLFSRFGLPRVVITDKLRSYIKPIRQLAPEADHRAHKGLNNRIEGSHRPTRKREKLMGRFKSLRQHHGRLLIDTFYGHKVHIRARNSLADRFRISRIILLPLNVGFHISRGNEPHIVAQGIANLLRPLRVSSR